MSFINLKIKDEYRSKRDNIVRDFYIPILNESVIYQRAVGFFSSTSLAMISKGISSIVQNEGYIQLIASPFLSEEDVKAIRTGYQERNTVIRNSLLRALYEPKNIFEEERLNLLANLISNNRLDIKIALLEKEHNFGMFHEKMGIMVDEENNKIAFSGSMNESNMAMTLNYEAFDVFCDWRDKKEAGRVNAKIDAFNTMWNNHEEGIEVSAFPDINKAIIEKYQKRKQNLNIDSLEAKEIDNSLLSEDTDLQKAFQLPIDLELYDYQQEAIDQWEKQDFKGIFDMATGTGKTLTGLGAISRLCEVLNDKLAVIIVCPFQHLVEQWVEDIINFNCSPIIGYSASQQRDWMKRLDRAIINHKLKVRNHEFFCFICTNATYSTERVQEQLNKIKGDALLVVDEAHNFGSERLSELLLSQFKYRLALSATIIRHNDIEGTSKLYNYFGEKCIEYTLERAIAQKKLTRYKYYPIITTLNEDELKIYSDLSREIGKCMIKSKNGKFQLNSRGKILALERARLVAGLSDKIEKLKEFIQPFTNDKHILIYCGATTLLKEGQDISDTFKDEIRQIDYVTHILGNSFNMKVSQFTSREDIKERERLKKEFSIGDNLQALVAIKCLDEGVNIPAIKTAFILASTTNPKEYIQRRGRVLRRFPGKDFAIIYDFIALPRSLTEVPSLTDEQVKRELTLVKNELSRAEEFARLSTNMAEAELTINLIKEAYSINDFLNQTEEEDFIYD